MNNLQAQRLLNVSSALREALHPRYFRMSKFGYDCGSPACALGHYAARIDMQRTFNLSQSGALIFSDEDISLCCDDIRIRNHFGVTLDEVASLFCSVGCDNAQTPIQAAKYIEKFLDNRGWTHN